MLVLLKHEISLEYFRTRVWVEDKYIRVLQIVDEEDSRALIFYLEDLLVFAVHWVDCWFSLLNIQKHLLMER